MQFSFINLYCNFNISTKMDARELRKDAIWLTIAIPNLKGPHIYRA